MALIADLFNLQKVDYNAVKVRRRFQEIQKALTASSELAAARERVSKVQTELSQLTSEQKDCELEAESLANRIAETDKQLMSGETTNHKELESLQANLEALKRQKDAVESRSVEVLEQIEKLASNLENFQSELETVEGAWKQKVTALKSDGQKLQQQFQLLKKKRKVIVQSLDKSALELYDQLRKRKGGVAVAPLKEDTCGACNMQVPSGVISSARSTESEPVYCPSCGRILFSGM